MEDISKNFVKRNVFNLSHDAKFDCDMGQLIPILVEETLPGDTFKVTTDMLVRCAPMVSPMYHEVNVFTRYFFVPNRLVWTEWQEFITGGPDGLNASVPPTINFGSGCPKYSLMDYMGWPVVAQSTIGSALPIRCYDQIYNDWFLDQTLQTPIVISKASGDDTTSNWSLLNVNWEKDYFTSSLPKTQRGNPVSLPLGTSAPVNIPGGAFPNQLVPVAYNSGNAYPIGYDNSGNLNTQAGIGTGTMRLTGQSEADGDLIGTADLTGATASTINDLRLAFQLQRFMEKLARSGARYVEYNMAMFGVRSSDARLQRAEYLGGGKSQVIVSEVIQTSATSGQPSPLGNLAGHGFSAHRSHEFKKSFEEHGYVIGLMYILPRTSYYQGLSRTLTRSTKFDYYVPLLAHLGEQAVLNKEIYFDPTDGENNDVFGYQGRFDEYRRRESRVSGDFRNTTGLGTWHMGRTFASRPALNASFIQANPTKRPFATTNVPEMWVYLKNNVKAIRPLPKLGEPGYIDH